LNIFQDLESRLRDRGTENEESVRRRLEEARKELELLEKSRNHFDLIIINDDVDRAYKELECYLVNKLGKEESIKRGNQEKFQKLAKFLIERRRES
jgi:guanylate kinase